MKWWRIFDEKEARWLAAALSLTVAGCSNNQNPGGGPSSQLDMGGGDMTIPNPTGGMLPMLTTVMPPMGPTLGGIPIQLGGQGFTDGARVLFANTAANIVTVVSDMQIQAMLPSNLGAWGKVPVEVALPNGMSSTRSDLFSYYASLVQFSGPTALNTDASPVALLIADFNGDKKDDLAVANTGADSVSILLGQGGGMFEQATSFAVGMQPVALRAVDLNNDSKLDLVVANGFSSNLSILLGNGDGTFKAAVNVAITGTPSALAVADFNLDGQSDVAVAAFDNGKVYILPGNGDGTLNTAAMKTVSGFKQPSSLYAGDVSGDLKNDLLVAGYGDNSVNVLLGKGDGTFQNPTAIPVGTAPLFVTAVDLDGDKVSDMLSANSGSANLSVAFGKGDGTFGSPQPISTGHGPNSVAAADFNGDGVLDLAVSTYDDGVVGVLLGNGDGTFGGAINTPAVSAPFSVATRDFNGDGKPDIAITSRNTPGQVLIFPNNSQ